MTNRLEALELHRFPSQGVGVQLAPSQLYVSWQSLLEIRPPPQGGISDPDDSPSLQCLLQLDCVGGCSGAAWPLVFLYEQLACRSRWLEIMRLRTRLCGVYCRSQRFWAEQVCCWPRLDVGTLRMARTRTAEHVVPSPGRGNADSRPKGVRLVLLCDGRAVRGSDTSWRRLRTLPGRSAELLKIGPRKDFCGSTLFVHGTYSYRFSGFPLLISPQGIFLAPMISRTRAPRAEKSLHIAYWAHLLSS